VWIREGWIVRLWIKGVDKGGLDSEAVDKGCG